MDPFLFQNWESLLRIALSTVVVYGLLVLFLRLFGTRSTAKMNTFDWAVTVALGSMVATIILSKSVVLADGLVAIVMLLVMQYGSTFLASRSHRFHNLITNPPCLLFYDGTFLKTTMRKERVAPEDIQELARQAGYASLDQVLAVVLESSSHVSVIARDQSGEIDLLRELSGFPKGEGKK